MNLLSPEVTRAGIVMYEEMTGTRLPDGDGYDHDIVTAMFTAMLSVALQPTELKDMVSRMQGLIDWKEEHQKVVMEEPTATLNKLVATLRHRANTGSEAHGPVWVEAVRFAANQIEHEVQKLSKVKQWSPEDAFDLRLGSYCPYCPKYKNPRAKLVDKNGRLCCDTCDTEGSKSFGLIADLPPPEAQNE